jgi:hypothetical protein
MTSEVFGTAVAVQVDLADLRLLRAIAVNLNL